MSGNGEAALAAADSAWWRMEHPANQMAITAVLTFDAPLDCGRLKEVLRTRLVVHPPFRQRVAEPRLPFGRPRWEDDPAFALENHLHRVSLPEPAGDRELQVLVSDLMSVPLDRSRPLWHFHYVDNYRGGSALVARLHHCIADGIALIHLLLTLDDVEGNESAAAVWGLSGRPHPPVDAVPWPRRVGAAAASLAHLVLMPPDRRSAFRGPLHPRKRAAWSQPVSLAELRGVAAGVGGTLHDLLAAALAGALGSYLRARGTDPARTRVHAVVPVNLRPPGEVDTLGNRFGLVFLPLPVEVPDPEERLRRVQRTMSGLKRSPEALVVYALLRVFGRTTRSLVGLAVRFLGWKASLVFTDVPGPREPVSFCGAGLRDLMAWVPQSGRLGLGVSVLSYAGQLQVGIAADEGLVPDPEALVEAYSASLAEMAALAERAAPPPLQEA
jgi:diacylglycerol O-acyltransferase